MRNISAPDSCSTRPNKWMKWLIITVLLIALAGASVVSACPEMGTEMTDSCCSKPTCEDHPCAPELCIAKPPYLSTGSETGPDFGSSILASAIAEAANEVSVSPALGIGTPCSVASGDPQALLQIFRI